PAVGSGAWPARGQACSAFAKPGASRSARRCKVSAPCENEASCDECGETGSDDREHEPGPRKQPGQARVRAACEDERCDPSATRALAERSALDEPGRTIGRDLPDAIVGRCACQL